MKRFIGIRTLKTGIGAVITLLIGNALGLQYAASAAVITILSIQSTKRQSVEIAIKRFIATVIALLLAAIIFEGIGFYPFSFGLFLILFIPIAAKGNMVEGIVPASVLVTHLLSSNGITFQLMLNEIALVVIGVIVALVINLYMPSMEEEIIHCRRTIETMMYAIFMNMAEALSSYKVNLDEECYKLLGEEIEEGQLKAYRYANNYLLTKQTPFIRYFRMRNKQYQVMLYMKEHFTKFFMTYEQTEIVADFTKKVAKSIHGEQSAKELLEQLEMLRQTFRESALPSSREEFENRAMLYQFLNDLEHFLQIKRDFRQTLTQEELKEYMKGYAKE